MEEDLGREELPRWLFGLYKLCLTVMHSVLCSKAVCVTKVCETPRSDNATEAEEVSGRCINLTAGVYALTSQVGSRVGKQDKQDAEKIKRKSNWEPSFPLPLLQKTLHLMNTICFEIKSKQLYNASTKYLKEGS